ncbi:MAG: hypothetical protein Q8L98_01835 [Chlamydiales bacterium]|nr:hypothetical protein [Chlamydiales bacterium]
MSHIPGTSQKVNESFTEDTMFLGLETPDFSSLEENTQEVASPILMNKQDEFHRWDVFSAGDAERYLRTNDDMPSENLAFKDIDYELLNSEESQENSFLISTEKTATTTSPFFVEKQNHKRKHSTNQKDDETRKPKHRRFDDTQEYQNFLNQGLLTDDFIEDSNPNSFLTSQAFDTSEKSIEQTAFDERLYAISPLRFDEQQTETSAFLEKKNHKRKRSTNPKDEETREPNHRRFDDKQEYQNFLNQGVLTDDFMEDSNSNSFLTSQGIDTSEKSIEQTAFDERFYAMSSLSFDEPQTATPVLAEKEENHPNVTLWARNFLRMRTLNLARINDILAEESIKQPKKRLTTQDRMLLENDLIERVLTSDTTPQDEQEAKKILRKRKSAAPTVREVEMSKFSRRFRLLNLWLLDQRLRPDDEQDVKEQLLKEIKKYREKWGTRAIQQTGPGTDS